MDIVEEVTAAIRCHHRVTAVTLVGSRRGNTATSVSDWDFVIDTPEPRTVFDDLPEIVASFEPLGAFWDPLADHHRNYIAVFPSLVTLDLHLDLPPPLHEPWKVDSDTLAAIDTHFWNWALWLKGKTLHGQHALVANELVKMHRFLLEPMGCEASPRTLDEAVGLFLVARTNAEEALGVPISGNHLETEALAALRPADE